MDRRSSPRIPLDAPCLLTIVVNYGDSSFQAMAVDVSQGGVQLALPPGMPEDGVSTGAPVTLCNVPSPLDEMLEGAHGKVAWTGKSCCGVRLNKPLEVNASELTDFARL